MSEASFDAAKAKLEEALKEMLAANPDTTEEKLADMLAKQANETHWPLGAMAEIVVHEFIVDMDDEGLIERGRGHAVRLKEEGGA